MFMPVDVPLVPEALLRKWAEAVLEQGKAGCGVSYLLVLQERQPAFAMVRREYAVQVSKAVDAGERQLGEIWMGLDDEGSAGWVWAANAERFGPTGPATKLQMECWFKNVNTPEDLAEAEAWADEVGWAK